MMHKLYGCVLTVALVTLPASHAAAGELKLTMSNGLVTIMADQVPVSVILSEWARVGQTRIVNGDKLMTTISLQLVDMPERKALDIVLRSASGYMAAERQAGSVGVSAFDRIMILPFSKGPANSLPASPIPAPFTPRPVPPPAPMPPPTDLDDDSPLLPPGFGPQQPQPSQQPQQPVMMPSLPGMPPQGAGTPQQPQQVPGQPPKPQTLPRPGMLPPVSGPQGTIPGTPGKPPGGGGGPGI